MAFPAGGPALLVGVLGAGLEEEAHGAAGDGDLEVAVLLVAALVVGEGHPGIVGRIDRAASVPGHVGEGLRAADPRHVGQEVAPGRLQLGADPRLDGLHAGLEAGNVEDLEVGGREAGEHAGPPGSVGGFERSEVSSCELMM